MRTHKHDKIDLRKIFFLESEPELYKEAITPKSCGGGDNLKNLALFGDNVLNITLLKFFSKKGIKNSGKLTVKIKAIHNEWTLLKIGEFLGITDEMNPKDFNHEISDNELKESVEALIGATFKVHGLSKCELTIEKLLKIVEENLLYDSNPIGKLIEYFHKFEKEISFPDPVWINEPIEPRLYRCIIEESFNGKNYKIKSDDFPRKSYARKDAALKFLSAIGLTKSDGLEINRQQKEESNTPEQSLSNEDLIFSKSTIGDGYFKAESMNLSTGSGETYAEYAKRKSDKKPFFTLISLSGRLDKVAGSTWHVSLPNGELILLNLKLGENDYFDIGFAESKNKAKKQVASKIIRNSNLYEWLEKTYNDEVI